MKTTRSRTGIPALIRKMFALTSVCSLAILSNVTAQCDPNSTAAVSISGITTTNETCPQSGSITVNGVSNGGGEYTYEITDGPIIRGIQSQHIFPALSAGTYTVRVTGCNGTFREAQATITAQYRKFSDPTLTFLKNTSFKCGNTADGKVVVTQLEELLTENIADTTRLKWPLRYQVSASSNPYTGFDGIPYHNFGSKVVSPWYQVASSNIIGARIKHTDTVTGLLAGQTYYIRVTDQCGVFVTKSVVLPTPNNDAISYSISLLNPYNTSGSNNYANTYTDPGCPQWGKLAYMINGNTNATISANSGFLPITALIKRQSDSVIVDQYTEANGGLNFPVSFRHIPRVPVFAEITDGCGNVQTISLNNPLALPAFNLQAFDNCSTPPGFSVKPINAAPSLPVHLKVYDSANTVVIDKMIPAGSRDEQFGWLQSIPAEYANLGQQNFLLPYLGTYRIVYEDDCGRTDSITHVLSSSPGAGGAAQPAFTFDVYQPACTANGLYTAQVTQTVASPVSSLTILSGPAGVAYPKKMESASIPTPISSQFVQYFDSLVAGTYQLRVLYGCNETYDTSFTIAATQPVPSISGNMTYTPNATYLCTEGSSSGKGTLSAYMALGANYIAAVLQEPQIRLVQAPAGFVAKIARSTNGNPVTLPLNLGNYDAMAGFNHYSSEGQYINYYSSGLSIKGTGIDTNLVSAYAVYAFRQLAGGSSGYSDANDAALLPGTYTFEMFGKCSGTLLSTLTFTVESSTYIAPFVGGSAAYICDNSTSVKLLANPSGGTPPYQYQIKPETEPDAAYTALQTGSLFSLPSSTSPGTVYNLRVVDNCGSSFVGRVPVNSLNATPYVFPYSNCIGDTASIITGLIPGATYTWTLPNNAVIVNNSNELIIPGFSASDTGNYTVSIDALNGCIVRTASGIIGDNCILSGPLPVTITYFTAQKNALGDVALEWITETEAGNSFFDIERSADGIHFNKILTRGTQAPGGNSQTKIQYSTTDASAADQGKSVLYYRLKQVGIDGKSSYSTISKVLFDDGAYSASVYPSPFKDILTVAVTTPERAPVSLTLHSADGRKVYTRVFDPVTAYNTWELHFEKRLAPGSYMLTVLQHNQVILSQKLLCKP